MADAVFPDVHVFNSQGMIDTLLIENAIRRGAKSITIVCDDARRSWDQFRTQFQFVQAAGGVVVNALGKILFIYRLEKWDLPKGKVESEEEISVAAMREVEEECSIHELTIRNELCTTWHTYVQAGEPVLKATAWYVMDYAGTEQPMPQQEEGITDVCWLGMDELDIVKAKTYPSVVEVLSIYAKKISG